MMILKIYKNQHEVVRAISDGFESFLTKSFVQCGYTESQIFMLAKQMRLSMIMIGDEDYYCVDDVKMFRTITRQELDGKKRKIKRIIGIEIINRNEDVKN